MFGFTVLFGKENPEWIVEYIKKMEFNGSKIIFTSLRMPEEETEVVKKNLEVVSKYIQNRNFDLIADVSTETFQEYTVDELINYGITTLRIDNGLTCNEIYKLSLKFKIIFNASVINQAFINEMKNCGYKEKFVAWHNYYPKLYTGLDTENFKKQNELLRQAGVIVGAFISGNVTRRGTIFEWLPTLEDHRGLSPFQTFLDMTYNYEVEQVILADYNLTDIDAKKFYEYLTNKIVVVELENLSDERILEYKYKNRVDIAQLVIRCTELKNKFIIENKANLLEKRFLGSVTIDNEGYGRYMGELQVVLKELPADERVNIVGNVIEQDLYLLEYLKHFTLDFKFSDFEKE